MRPLNRPMFKYGGPIKEGIMDGMQDRTIAGGNQVGTPMGNRTGFADPRKSIIKGVATRTPGLSSLIEKGRGIIPRIFEKIKPTFRMQPGQVTGGTTGTRQKYISQTMPKVPFMERAGAFVKENPYFTGSVGIGGTTSGLIPDIVTGGAGLLKKGVLQAADLLVDDDIFDQDKYFADKKLIELNKQKQKLKKKLKEKDKNTVDTVKKIDRDKEIQANRERYYKILGIDKMKKDSIYDSLIDASKIVTEEGGDLKGSIKSGTLQTKLIDAISKNLDKSADIKRQIDSAIVKGEIEKDINREKNTLDKLVKEKQLKVLDNQLKGGSLEEVLANLQSKQGIVPEGPELAALAIRKDIEIPTGHTLNTKDVNTFLKDNPTLTVVDYLNDQNLKLQQAGKGSLTAGNYVVGKNILEVGEDGTVTDIIV
tara:strand:- start:900 stop:2168 length:1269 start_codon:yes stop_codon:yes gene_type:complete